MAVMFHSQSLGLMRASKDSSRKLCGLLRRKERWGLSWRGSLLAILAFVLGGYVVVVDAPSFLAVTNRVDTKILVVEGWVSRYSLQQAAAEFKTGGYDRIFTTGGPEEGTGGYTNDYNTSASVGAEALKKVGVPADRIQMVPSHVVGRDRTYSAAVALHQWINDNHESVTSINVLTQGAHARRSRLLYQKAFSRDCRIGVISVASPDYDAKQWWYYSEGVREVIGESIAYIYARLFFHSPTLSNRPQIVEKSQSSR
jgi:hypothetical protein